MASDAIAPLFDAASRHRIGWDTPKSPTSAAGTLRKRRFSTAIFGNPQGGILPQYRKVHLPGHAEYDPKRVVQHPGNVTSKSEPSAFQ